MRYEDPDTRAVAEANKTFRRSELQGDFTRASPRFQLAAAVAEYAEILRASPYSRGEQLRRIAELARNLQWQLPYDPDVAEFAQLVGRAAEMMR